MEKISIILVDDHQMVRMGLKAYFDTLEDIEVIGEAGSGFEALYDDVITEVEVGASLASSSLLVPITMKNGDLIKPQVTRTDGTSTVTVKQYSVAVG